MAKINQDGITFNSVINDDRAGVPFGQYPLHILGMSGPDEDGGIINAVDIDWNDVTGIFGFTDENPLKTTGQLLHELNTTCASKPNLIKVNGNIYETELSYIGESYIKLPYIELPDYPNWYSLSGRPKTFKPIIGTTSTTAAAGNHTHQTSIVASTGTDAFAFAFGSTYTLNAGGTSFEFTMPSVPTIPTKVSQLLHELNTTCASKPNLIKVNGNIYETKIDDPSYIGESYIGEPYIELPDYPNWYSLSGKPTTFRPTIGKTSTTAAAGNHTHQTSIVASTGTDAFAFAFGSTYTLNAGGTSFEFTMPKLPTIPTKVSQLTNDKGYLTAHPAKGNPSITIGGDNTFIREIQFDDNGHFVSAYLMTIDELKELLGIGSTEEPVTETKKYVYVGQVDPRTEGFSFDDITAVEGSVIKEEVTSKVEVPISLNGPRNYWYIAAPKSLNYTYYDSTGQINVESQINIEYITIGGIEYKIYITAGKTVSFNQVLK